MHLTDGIRRPWTAAEEQMVLTMPYEEVMRRTHRSWSSCRAKRRHLLHPRRRFPPFWSEMIDQKIRELRALGHSIIEIAEITNIDRGAINRRMIKLGISLKPINRGSIKGTVIVQQQQEKNDRSIGPR